MNKKVIAFAIATLILASVHPAIAQQSVKLHRIAVLSEGTAARRHLREVAPLRQGLGGGLPRGQKHRL